MRADVGDHHRVTIWCGTRHTLRDDDAAAAGNVLDNERSIQQFAKLLGHRARNQVDAAARLHGRDDLDGVGRVSFLRPSWDSAECGERGNGQQDNLTNHRHASMVTKRPRSAAKYEPPGQAGAVRTDWRSSR